MVFTIRHLPDPQFLKRSPPPTVRWEQRVVKMTSSEKAWTRIATVALSVFSLGAYFIYLVCSKRGQIEWSNLKQGRFVKHVPIVVEEKKPEKEQESPIEPTEEKGTAELEEEKKPEKPHEDDSVDPTEDKSSRDIESLPVESKPAEPNTETKSRYLIAEGLPNDLASWDNESRRAIAYLLDCIAEQSDLPKFLTEDYLSSIAPDLSKEDIQKLGAALKFPSPFDSNSIMIDYFRNNLPFYLSRSVKRPDPFLPVDLIGSQVEDHGLVLESLNLNQLWCLKAMVDQFRLIESSLPDKVKLEDLQSVAEKNVWISLFDAIQFYLDPEGTCRKSALQKVFKVFDNFIEKRSGLETSYYPGLNKIGLEDRRFGDQENTFPSLNIRKTWSLSSLGKFLAIKKDKLEKFFKSKNVMSKGELPWQEVRAVLKNSSQQELNQLNNGATQRQSVRWKCAANV